MQQVRLRIVNTCYSSKGLSEQLSLTTINCFDTVTTTVHQQTTSCRHNSVQCAAREEGALVFIAAPPQAARMQLLATPVGLWVMWFTFQQGANKDLDARLHWPQFYRN